LSNMPKVECIELVDKYGRFVCEPLESGFGTTVGNALRRVLLGNMSGAAITQMLIEGIQHEFSSLPGAKEDATEFMLNVKGIRLMQLNEVPVGSLSLNVSGERVVTAADISPSNDYKIINPDLYLATLTTPSSSLRVNFTVKSGEGFQVAQSTTDSPIGTIPVDAIFTPIRKVNYKTEPMHMGRETSLERLILEVWTDGTVSPQNALYRAATRLMEGFSVFTGGQVSINTRVDSAVGALGLNDEKFKMSVEQLDLSVRTMNCLRHAGITTVGEVLARGGKELLTLRNFGRKSLTELEEKLASLSIPMSIE